LPLPFEELLACPACHGPLEKVAAGWRCAGCERAFGLDDGFPDFVLGSRFPDTDALALLDYEERANEACARGWYLPSLGSLFGRPSRPPRVLSVGCGTGVDVDVLAESGFDAVGLDCGHRNAAWPRRKQSKRFLLARGEHCPFVPGAFDAVVMGCVFPHVGVEGDSFRVGPHYRERRLELAREMARVLRPGGHLLVSSPNRRFPFDLFHRADPARRIPRPYRPRDPFLLSLSDYRDLFVDGAGCRSVHPLSIRGYWGFVNMGASWPTRVLRSLLRGWFAVASAAEPLRSSALAPWLCVHVVR
jgi:SAM-dependent methyltransferase